MRFSLNIPCGSGWGFQENRMISPGLCVVCSGGPRRVGQSVRGGAGKGSAQDQEFRRLAWANDAIVLIDDDTHTHTHTDAHTTHMHTHAHANSLSLEHSKQQKNNSTTKSERATPGISLGL